MEKESSLRLQLQGEIMTQMQQKLAHNKAAQDSQHLIAKMSTPKKAKVKPNKHRGLLLEGDECELSLETKKNPQEIKTTEAV